MQCPYIDIIGPTFFLLTIVIQQIHFSKMHVLMSKAVTFAITLIVNFPSYHPTPRGFNNPNEIIIMMEKNIRLTRETFGSAEYRYNLLDLTTYYCRNDVVICTDRCTELENLYESIQINPEALVSHINRNE